MECQVARTPQRVSSSGGFVACIAGRSREPVRSAGLVEPLPPSIAGIPHPHSELSMTMEQRPSSVLEVWIDGDCAVCRRSERWCAAQDPHGRLSFVDLHAPGREDLPGSPEAMIETVHVRHPSGTVSTGFDAWRSILSELDSWRWLARLAGLPVIKQLGPVIYSILAKNRHRIPISRR